MSCLPSLARIILLMFCILTSVYGSLESETTRKSSSPTIDSTDFSGHPRSTDAVEETRNEKFSTISTPSTITTTPNPQELCSCEEIKLGLIAFSPSEIGSTNFEIRFNASSSSCENISLTEIFVQRHGPLNIVGVGPKNSTCNATVIECTVENICSFNCTFEPEGSWIPCGNYELQFFPKYSDCQNATEQPLKVQETAPPPEGDLKILILNVTASDNSFSLRWSVEPETYLPTINGYIIELHSKLESSSLQIAQIPLNCTTEIGGVVTFNTSKCPGYLNVVSCNSYSVRVKALLICAKNETQYSPVDNFFTLPPKKLLVSVYNVTAGSRWFSFSWSLSEQRCIAATTNLMLSITSLYPTDSTYLISQPNNCARSKRFESLGCAVNITSGNESAPPFPCTAYQIEAYPQIWDVNYQQYTSTKITAKTIPDTDLRMQLYDVRTGAQWISFGWNLSDNRCEHALTALKLNVMNEESSYSVTIWRNCSSCDFNSSNHSCVLNETENTGGCPSIPISSCSRYNLSVYPQIWDTDYVQYVGKNTAETIPTNDLKMKIFDISTGSRWFSFSWNLSDTRCVTATTSLMLNITDTFSPQSAYIFPVRNNCAQSNERNPLSCSVNITSFEPDPVLPCTEYKFQTFPKIWGVDYPQFNAQGTANTSPGEELKVNVRNITSGPTWISLQWNLSEARCMRALTGVRRIITGEDLQSNSTHLTVNCSGCGFQSDSFCLMNTTAGIECPTFKMSPCTQYEIYLYPEIWSTTYVDWLFSQTVSSTTPDEYLHADILENTLSSGSSWISFKWQASTETCRKKIDSYIVKEISSNGENRCLTAGNDIVAFNTTMECFNQTLMPCRGYSFSLILLIGQDVVGRPTKVERTTLHDESLMPIIKPVSQGLDWFTFNWTLSDKSCNKYIDSYTVNVTEFVTSAPRSQTFRHADCSESFTENFLFNSSCSANLSITRCSRYYVTLSSKLFINNEEYALASSSKTNEFETLSGDWGDVENLMVRATYPRALTLEWTEPRCRDTAVITNYNITATSTWSSAYGQEEKSEVLIPPSCVTELPNVSGTSRRVYVTVNESMCGNLGVQLRSCAPYELIVAPTYNVTKANEDVTGRIEKSSTEARPEDLNVNLDIKDTGSRWFLLSWRQPNCSLPVVQWTLDDNSLNQSISVLPDCLSNSNQISLNVSNNVCGNMPGIEIKPCTNHSFALKLMLSNISDILPTENGTTSGYSSAEDPGNVTNVSYESYAREVYVKWSPPNENPQCVRSYRIDWKGNSTERSITSIPLNSLEACENFPIAITALSDVFPPLNRVEENVRTQSIAPAPVNASSVSFQLLEDSRGLLSWAKPGDEVDDCITGYLVTFREKDSDNVAREQNAEGKNTTDMFLSDKDFQPGKTYVAHIISKNSIIAQSAPAIKTFTWKSSSGVISTAALIVSPLVIVTILFLLFLLYLKRTRKSTQDAVIYDVEFSVVRKPVLIEDFNQVLGFLEADSGYELSKEYEEVKRLSAAHPCNVATRPENAERNRYLDILPFDHSRVRLRAVSQADSSDYINASFIMGAQTTPLYIAAQGPKPSTIEHFWRMCLEQDVRVIVALTTLEERGRIKCAQYWPTEGGVEYGIVRVELVSTVEKTFFTQRKLYITVNGESTKAHVMYQLHFTEWPDFGCPEKPESLIELVYAMRRENASFLNTGRSATPILVHCSAGVGRTGTLIALDLLMKQANENKFVDVMGTTLRIREDRAKMIQNEDQYRFLYRCLGCYINRDLFKQD